MKFRLSHSISKIKDIFLNQPVDNATATVSEVFTNIDFENIKESWNVEDKCPQNSWEDIHKDSARVSLNFSEIVFYIYF